MTRMFRTLLVTLLATPALLLSQGRGGGNARPATIAKSGTVPLEPNVEKRLQTDFKAPDGFKITLFAGPPVAMYPTCVADSPDGAMFVCVDPNLSLSTLKGVGRVMRLVDADHDGHADNYTVFAEMDSPRGVVSDGKTVYVMHPPMLTAYTDTTGDGISDISKDIITGLGFDLDFRGADHTTNNVQIGPDGWLYVAVGDYGFQKAVGTDGKSISHRGGAVVRVRPDGTNIEIVATGTRNIYDVSIDPFARVYARDNTNDGDGWNTRLHYLPSGANMGYPSQYQNFKTEHFPSLFDYGAGAGVGSFWLQDPAWPAGFNNTLFTGDWTMQRIYRHTLTPAGASYAVQQDEFISVQRPSDITLDGNSNMYVSSLSGGQFNYNSDTVGYVVQVRAPGARPAAEASVFKATDAALLASLGSGNALHRLHAQQELLRRGAKASTVRSLYATVADKTKSAEARAAAMFTVKQLDGAKANAALITAAASTDPRVREVALRVLVDRLDQQQGVSSALFVKALADADGQVKVQAIRGLVRLGARDVASSLVPLTDTTDQALSHLAVSALVSLNASDAALKGIDGTPAVRAGALRALAMMRDPAVVTALVERTGKATDATVKSALLHTLARQYNREGDWKGDWWTTKPAHLGPYFDPAPWAETPRIRSALVAALTASSGDAMAALVGDMVSNQTLPRGALPLLAAVTTAGNPLRAPLIDAMVGRTSLDDKAVAIATQLDAQGDAMHNAVAQLLAAETAFTPATLSLARTAALDTRLAPDARASLLSSIGQVPGPAALDVASRVFASLNPTPSAAPAAPADPIEGAWRRYVGDRRRTGELDYFINLAKTGDAPQRTLAYAVLLQATRGARTPPPVREKVTPVLDAAWTDAASAPSLVAAIGVMRLESQFTEKLAAYNANKPK